MTALPALHVGAPVQAGPLTLFPIWTDAPLHSRRRYVTTGAVVEELPEPEVATLRVSNPRHRPLLLCEGTILEGGWQHRAVAISVVVEPGQTEDVPVLCVEAGRWGGEQSHGGGRRRVLAATRGAIRGLSRGVPEPFDLHLRQQDVWDSVERSQERFGRSEARSMVDVHRGVEQRVATMVASTAPLPAQRGVVIGIGGHPVLMEVFDHPRLLATHWRYLVAAAAIDALDVQSEATPSWRARSFARHAMASGIDLPDPVADAMALIRDDELVHLSAVSALHPLVLAA